MKFLLGILDAKKNLNVDRELFNLVRRKFSALGSSEKYDDWICSGWAYLTLWRDRCLGRVTLSGWGYFPLKFSLQVWMTLREFAAAVLSPVPMLVSNPNPQLAQRKIILISWFHGNSNELQIDRYLGNLGARLEPEVSRILICDGSLAGPFEKNCDAYIVRKKNLSQTLAFGVQFLWYFSRYFYDSKKWLPYLSIERRDAYLTTLQIVNWLRTENISPHAVSFPNEQQPWQLELVRQLRARGFKAQTIGYNHSSLNNVPVQFVRNKFSVDHFLVHGEANKKVLNDFLGWSSDQVSVIPSLRFRKKISVSKAKIFLPYSFTDESALLRGIADIVSKVDGFFEAEIGLHPDRTEDPNHLKLKSQVRDLLKNQSPVNARPMVVIVGVSTALIEAIEAGIETYGVFQEPNKDQLPEWMWQDLAVKQIGPYSFAYELKKTGSFIVYSDIQNADLNIVDHIKKRLAPTLTIRPANLDDSVDLWNWRNDPITRAMSRSTDPIAWEEHERWYRSSLQRQDRMILMGHSNAFDSKPIGMCRFDEHSDDTTEISINLNPAARGFGLSVPLLCHAIDYYWTQKKRTIIATVKNENRASHKSFIRAGFKLLEKTPVETHYQKLPSSK